MSDICTSHYALQGARRLVTGREHVLSTPQPGILEPGRFRLKTAAAWARRALYSAAAPAAAQREAYV
jgi:hypothetical protein